MSQLDQGIALEFERCDAARKLRLLLSEILFIMYQVASDTAVVCGFDIREKTVTVNLSVDYVM